MAPGRAVQDERRDGHASHGVKRRTMGGYSLRTLVGSRRAARRAGSQPATRPVPISTAAASSNVSGLSASLIPTRSASLGRSTSAVTAKDDKSGPAARGSGDGNRAARRSGRTLERHRHEYVHELVFPIRDQLVEHEILVIEDAVLREQFPVNRKGQ
jgi:hypothetical protein